MLSASNFIDLRIEEPYLSLKINMTAIERGKEGDMICDLSIKRPFIGMGKLELKGLPPFSKTTVIEFDSNSKQVSFPVQVEEKARAGVTKNLFCFARVPYEGNAITHSVGQGGQIRLDNPPPGKKSGSSKKSEPVKKVQKEVKTLSRLEQLRLAEKESIK